MHEGAQRMVVQRKILKDIMGSIIISLFLIISSIHASMHLPWWSCQSPHRSQAHLLGECIVCMCSSPATLHLSWTLPGHSLCPSTAPDSLEGRGQQEAVGNGWWNDDKQWIKRQKECTGTGGGAATRYNNNNNNNGNIVYSKERWWGCVFIMNMNDHTEHECQLTQGFVNGTEVLVNVHWCPVEGGQPWLYCLVYLSS